MLTTASKYYIELFKYKELTPILGRPTLDALIVIFQKLKISCQFIPTALGGGQLGYLALVLKPAIYNAVPSAHNFVQPTHPGVFTPSGARLTAVEAAQEKAERDEAIYIYTKCNTVEQVLCQQLVHAVPSTYLYALCNENPDMINNYIPVIIDFFVRNYCTINPRDFNAQEHKLKNMIHNSEQHLNGIFNAIKTF